MKVNRKKRLLLPLIFGLILSISFGVYCFAFEITSAEVIYPRMKTGAPSEPIRIGLNTSNLQRNIFNVTLYYSFNSTEFNNKGLMRLIEGNNTFGQWEYEFSPQPNGTTLYFYAKVYFTNGDTYTPLSPKDARYWKIWQPNPSIRLHYFSVESIDEKKLTADVKCSIDINWPIDSEWVEVRLYNKMEKNVLSEERILKIPADTSKRFWYHTQIDIKNLRLTGDDFRFPYDKYFLDLNFLLPQAEKAILDVFNVHINKQDSYIWKDNWEGNIKSDNIIRIYTSFIRRPQNRFWFSIQILVFLFILGGSYMLDSYDKIDTRIRIYIGLIFYLFTFSLQIQRFVPERAIGISFAEIILPYLALFVCIYLLFTIINYKIRKHITKNHIKLNQLAIEFLFEILSVGIVTLISMFSVVIKNKYFISITLLELIPLELSPFFTIWPFYGSGLKLYFYKYKTNHQ